MLDEGGQGLFFHIQKEKHTATKLLQNNAKLLQKHKKFDSDTLYSRLDFRHFRNVAFILRKVARHNFL